MCKFYMYAYKTILLTAFSNEIFEFDRFVYSCMKNAFDINKKKTS